MATSLLSISSAGCSGNGRPVLLLLDEVLKYMERSGAVAVLDSTLRRQAMDFFQNLTVEVAGSPNAALVFSLQWSAREAMQNVALDTELVSQNLAFFMIVVDGHRQSLSFPRR
jgi:hypothetical protein